MIERTAMKAESGDRKSATAGLWSSAQTVRYQASAECRVTNDEMLEKAL
jgi:hypothetical protein